MFIFIKLDTNHVTELSSSSSYNYFDGLGCIRYYTQNENWYTARTICRSEHSDLAIIDPENNALELQAYHQFLGK